MLSFSELLQFLNIFTIKNCSLFGAFTVWESTLLVTQVDKKYSDDTDETLDGKVDNSSVNMLYKDEEYVYYEIRRQVHGLYSGLVNKNYIKVVNVMDKETITK